MEKYLVIHPSGLMEWVELERKPRYDGVYNGENVLSLDDIRKIVGCDWLEQVHTTIFNVVMYIDEVGKILPQPKAHNELASRLYGGWKPLRLDDIRGTAVLFALRPCNELGELDLYPLLPSQLEAVAREMGVAIPPA